MRASGHADRTGARRGFLFESDTRFEAHNRFAMTAFDINERTPFR
jgi:hypothetical protein